MSCYQCSSQKTKYNCGLCQVDLCKSCSQFLDEDTFSLLPKVEDKLKHTVYCATCFQNEVQPALTDYDNLLQAARQIQVYMHDQGKETRLMKRDQNLIEIKNCSDEKDVLLKLAVRAVQMGFNTLVDTEAIGTKVKTGSYSTTVYTGKGRPTQIDERHIIKDRSLRLYPN